MPWLRCNFPNLVLLDYVHGEEWYWRNGGYARTSGLVSQITEKTYVCNSVTKKVLEESFNRKPESVKTLHIGVDIDYFDPSYITSDYVYEKYGIENERPIVLFICRFYPEKRPMMMIEIAKTVKKMIPNVSFLAVGDGVLYEEMQKKTEKYELGDTIYFTGSQDEVRPFYKAAKLTLICSFKEGLALTAYESCAMGVPVISADVGGQKDLINDEVGALIKCRNLDAKHLNEKVFDEKEVMEYAHAIIEFLTNDEKWKTASENCRKKIEKGFTIKKMVENISEEFESLYSDKELKEKRQKTSEILRSFTKLFADYFAIELKEQSLEDGYNTKPEFNKYGLRDNDDLEERITSIERSLKNYQEVLNRHEEIVFCHEKAINHYDEVINCCEKVLNHHEEVLNRHEEVVNRHEEVVNRHEEVVNRHEEVVNRHEGSINHQWNIQKWHEERLKNVEKSMIGKFVDKIRRR